ncbi:MAG: HNH endonuclease [Proteobacteria bacterium]|nr:HNH endonuclease [Pseudomonadota bacterium]MBU1389723.1 HNH endonuclease [Pseudomonadota bacterium]MBU1542661.1 HNH endonuclease [Pseudomonadota bacterium]MBU2431505.1 HNH endonuclease [Pseudomonadota bacterium]MBU2480726.1 HNH endonuclease [Pseudomonadota bacterium]
MNGVRLKDNVRCPYCGRDLNETPGIKRIKEHVIGRKFIPKTYLENEWNFIVDACDDCNNEKGWLENGLSTISTLKLTGNSDLPIEVQDDLKRKIGNPGSDNIFGKSKHPETNEPVANSFIETKIKGNLGKANISFSFTAPPQAPTSETSLACYHIQAFFFLISNVNANDIKKSKAFTQKSIYLSKEYIKPLYILREPDWGNIPALELTKRTRNWRIFCNINTAKGFFRAVIRKSPDEEKSSFFWALEWNKSIRIIGMIMNSEQNYAVLENLPKEPLEKINSTVSVRKERQIKKEDDILFSS